VGIDCCTLHLRVRFENEKQCPNKNPFMGKCIKISYTYRLQGVSSRSVQSKLAPTDHPWHQNDLYSGLSIWDGSSKIYSLLEFWPFFRTEAVEDRMLLLTPSVNSQMSITNEHTNKYL
jgi:hypothetical protein